MKNLAITFLSISVILLSISQFYSLMRINDLENSTLLLLTQASADSEAIISIFEYLGADK